MKSRRVIPVDMYQLSVEERRLTVWRVAVIFWIVRGDVFCRREEAGSMLMLNESSRIKQCLLLSSS